MKKIGILTFQNADNYGALLQAYALKEMLLSVGMWPEVLNYRCLKLEREYCFFSNPRLNLKWLLVKTVKLFFLPFFLYEKSLFNSFRKRYLTDTSSLYPQTISKIASQYDVFISGSDQVFNPRITDFDANYFLAFNPDSAKNYSYAASFGLALENLTEKERNFIKKNLSYFTRISVRETQGAEIVRDLLNRPAEIHLDPTLLLTHAQWHSLAVTPKYSNYVILYLMHKDPQLIDFARKLAQAKGCELLYICPTLDFKNRVRAKHITPSPQEWLGLFENASYVVTNSFHGLAFSVNFNKKFFLGKLPLTWPVNSRLDNLLHITGLHDRLYGNFTDDFDKEIDWEAVNQKLKEERQKAFAYLREIAK